MNFKFFLPLFFIAVSCTQISHDNSIIQNEFPFSPNKVWAHRVNTLEEVEKKHQLFDGMEIDLIYSRHLNNFYVTHNEIDTLNGVLLDEWIKYIPNFEKNWFWLDMKNLNKKNADEIAALLVEILNKYGVFHKTICESKNVKALATLQKNGLAICYWINSDVSFRKITGDKLWKKRIERKIKRLRPNALSSFSWMHPLLDSSFPNENILYWNISEKETPESIECTKELCRLPNVKVVLVDYDEPIVY